MAVKANRRFENPQPLGIIQKEGQWGRKKSPEVLQVCPHDLWHTGKQKNSSEEIQYAAKTDRRISEAECILGAKRGESFLKWEVTQRSEKESKWEISHEIWQFGGYQWAEKSAGEIGGLEAAFHKADLEVGNLTNDYRLLSW